MSEVLRPEPVVLTPEEQGLLARITFDAASLRYETAQTNGEAVAALMESLLERNAIPEIRLRYFNDPDLNIGGHESSRQAWFQRRQPSLEDVVRHPHFLPYLHYFLFGPDLPASVIEGLRQIIEEDMGTGGMVRDQLRGFARTEVRRRSLDQHHAMEEFFKLALECGLERDAAWSIRDAVRDTR